MQLPSPFTAVITGAGGGIGQALTRHLATLPDCARVFAVSRTPPANTERVIGIEADACDARSVSAAAEQTAREAEAIDVLIHCVGLLSDDSHGLVPEKSLRELKPEHVANVLDVNLISAMRVAQAFQPLMRQRAQSVMAFLSARVGSISDNRLGGWYAYRCSKAALNQFVRTLSVECPRVRAGPTCLALHPGTVDTALSRPFQGNVPAGQLFSPERAAQQLWAVIAGATPDDTGALLAWDGQRIEW